MLLSHFIPIASRLWLSLFIIFGLAAGRAKNAWQDISGGGLPGEAEWGYVVLAFAGVGFAFIVFCLFYLCRQRERPRLFGMKRLHWLVGAPLAWLCGIGLGIMWEAYMIRVTPPWPVG